MSLYRRKDTDGNPITFFWYCEFVDEGNVIRRSTDVEIRTGSTKAFERSKAAARQAEALVKQEYFREKKEAADNAGAKDDIRFEAFTERFLDWIRVRFQSKPKTVSYYQERAAALLRFEPFKKAMVSRVDNEMVEDFVQWRRKSTKVFPIRGKEGKVMRVDSFRPIAVATVNRDLSVLKRILKTAAEWKYRTQQPKIRSLSGEEGHERCLTHQEEAIYLSAAPQPLKDFATLCLDGGFRPDSELCSLRWEDVRLEPAGNAKYGYVHIPRGKTKNSKRNVLMTKRARVILERRHKEAGEPKAGFVFQREDKTAIPYTSIDSMHDRTLKKTEQQFRIYDFRHTFGTRLGEAGSDAFTIMKAMGHSSILVSQRYLHPTPERMETAFTALDAYNEERQTIAENEIRKTEARKAENKPKARSKTA